MRKYAAFYKGKKIEVSASSMFEAQQKAAKELGAKKAYDVAIMLADVPVDPASL